MRYLLTTLAATTPSVRHGPPCLVHLASEEFQALAGVYRADLSLDEGDMALSLHLAAPESLHLDCEHHGKVYPMESNLPFNIIQSNGWSSAQWSACRAVQAGEEGDDNLDLNLQLGNLYLEGRGQRGGDFRCPAFAGTVFEGGEDPCVVGRFSMQLSLPIQSDVTPLEEAYRARIASQPAPPLTYERSEFVGQWRLLLSTDEDRAPAHFAIELKPDRTWESVGADERLAGTWGMYSNDPTSLSDKPDGSNVWLKVHADRCTETINEGVAGLPLRSDFHLWGEPVLTVEQELAQRAAGGSQAERVDGRLWAGLVEPEFFGQFSLLRGWGVSNVVSNVDPDVQRRREEEEAKRAWLSRLDAPGAWGGGAKGGVSAVVAPPEILADLTTACDSGAQTACEELSLEEAAKRAWLESLGLPAWGPLPHAWERRQL